MFVLLGSQLWPRSGSTELLSASGGPTRPPVCSPPAGALGGWGGAGVPAPCHREERPPPGKTTLEPPRLPHCRHPWGGSYPHLGPDPWWPYRHGCAVGRPASTPRPCCDPDESPDPGKPQPLHQGWVSILDLPFSVNRAHSHKAFNMMPQSSRRELPQASPLLRLSRLNALPRRPLPDGRGISPRRAHSLPGSGVRGEETGQRGRGLTRSQQCLPARPGHKHGPGHLHSMTGVRRVGCAPHTGRTPAPSSLPPTEQLLPPAVHPNSCGHSGRAVPWA